VVRPGIQYDHGYGACLNYPATTLTSLLGLAVADAFGCPFEFHEGAPEFSRLSIDEGRYLSCWDDVRQPVRRCRTSGLYSDDAQQSLILLWIWGQMVAKGRDPMRIDHMAELFIKVCRRMADEPVLGTLSFGLHRGTGQNFRSVILRGVVPDTAGLGGAMRIGPVATLIDDPALVMPWAVGVSASTTTHAVGLAGAAMVAAYAWHTSRYGWDPEPDFRALGLDDLTQDVQDAFALMKKALLVLRNRDEKALLDFATKTGISSHPLQCAADGFALTGVPWIIHAVDQATSFEDALLRVCASGGDTDTVAAVAGCLAALRFGMESIPSWMVDGLVGREHVVDPNLWHPLGSESPYVRMDKELQNKIEQQLRIIAAAQPRKGGKRKHRNP